MIELYDCGKKLHMRSGYPYTNDMMDATISMVIKAPRGTMALFKPEKSPHIHFVYKAQGDAIKLFMEEHSHYDK